MDKLVVISGPTASGKTELALKLAKKYRGEIIGADSRQIYKNLSIGTAKPRGTWRGGTYLVGGVPYHLVDIIEPKEPFSAAAYKQLALAKIKEVTARGRAPFLVGGTGLYISAVVNNLEWPAVPPSSQLRLSLEKKTLAELGRQLKALDPVTYKKIDLKNKRRLIRAVEICLKSGRPFSSQQEKGPPLFAVLQIGLAAPRPVLYNKIEKRVEAMIESGLVEEVKALLAAGYSSNLPAFSGLGYREIISFLQGRIDLAEAVSRIKSHTNAYARRQLTWFRKDPRIRWVEGADEAESLIKQFFKKRRWKIFYQDARRQGYSKD